MYTILFQNRPHS